MSGEHWSVKVYDNEQRGSDDRALCVYRAWPVGRVDLKACVSEATRFMRGKPAMYIIVRLDFRWVNGKAVPVPAAESIEHVLQAAGQ